MVDWGYLLPLSYTTPNTRYHLHSLPKENTPHDRLRFSLFCYSRTLNAFLYLWFNLKVLVCFWILPNFTHTCVAENWALSIVRRCRYQLLTATTSINLVTSLIMFFLTHRQTEKITNKMLGSIKNWFVCSHKGIYAGTNAICIGCENITFTLPLHRYWFLFK